MSVNWTGWSEFFINHRLTGTWKLMCKHWSLNRLWTVSCHWDPLVVNHNIWRSAQPRTKNSIIFIRLLVLFFQTATFHFLLFLLCQVAFFSLTLPGTMVPISCITLKYSISYWADNAIVPTYCRDVTALEPFKLFCESYKFHYRRR